MTNSRAEAPDVTRIDTEAPVLLAGEIEIDAAQELRLGRPSPTSTRGPTGTPMSRRQRSRETLPQDRSSAGRRVRPDSRPTLRQVVPPQVIAWTGESMGLDVIHVYTLEMRDGKTFVETKESVEGLLARLLRGPLQKTMNKSLERGLRALKVEAGRAKPAASKGLVAGRPGACRSERRRPEPNRSTRPARMRPMNSAVLKRIGLEIALSVTATRPASASWLALDEAHVAQSPYPPPLVLAGGEGLHRLGCRRAALSRLRVGTVLHVDRAWPPAGRGRDQRPGEAADADREPLHEPVRIELAQRLAALSPEPFAMCLFGSTGSEANEIALRSRNEPTGRFEIVALERGYHGRTLASFGALELDARDAPRLRPDGCGRRS